MTENRRLRIVRSISRTFPALLAVFLVWSAPSFARHQQGHNAFVAGETVRIRAPVCDTKEHADSVVQVYIDTGSPDAGIERLQELNNTDSEKYEGEPACFLFTGQVVILKEVSVFENAPSPAGAETVYVVKVKLKHPTLDRTYFVLSTWRVEPPGLGT